MLYVALEHVLFCCCWSILLVSCLHVGFCWLYFMLANECAARSPVACLSSRVCVCVGRQWWRGRGQERGYKPNAKLNAKTQDEASVPRFTETPENAKPNDRTNANKMQNKCQNAGAFTKNPCICVCVYIYIYTYTEVRIRCLDLAFLAFS